MFVNQSWVTYAKDDVEGWKSIGLARSAGRVGTRRKFVAIISDMVSMEMRMRMETVLDTILTLKGGETPFGKQAREYFNTDKFQGCVFIHPNCLMVTNSDFLFHEDGAQLVIGKDGGNGFETVGDNGGVVTNRILNCVVELDVSCTIPSPIPPNDVTIIYFANGHPMDKGVEPVGQVATDAVSLFRSLCPELLEQSPVPSSLFEKGKLQDSIAIIGLGCRYPGANTLDEFWDLLIKGMEGVRRVPDDRWTEDKAVTTMDNTRNTEAGFLSCPVENFDAKFFNVSGADAPFIDPQQRMALRVVWEALEHACIDPLSLKGSLTGVFGGWWKSDYKEIWQMLNHQVLDYLRGYLGSGLGPLTARISHFFEFIGPSFSTELGCSTSIAGVDLACSALRDEKCHLAVCVGVNLILHPFSLGCDKVEGLIAADGRCKVFDEAGDGFGRAEGAGVLILKRYPDAVRDGDRIWGLIRGEAVVQEGISKSMGTPTVEVEAKAMELALRRAGVAPSEIDFVEMHATGTPVGDPIESTAVARVYGKGTRENPLLIGSVKGNTGHTESVCGITSIQKMVLAIKNEVIPGTRNLKNMIPAITQDFQKIPAIVPLEPTPWKRIPHKERICAINSFGITGAQANIIVQEPPNSVPIPLWNFQDNRKLKILTFSGKFKDALQRNIENYMEFFGKDDSPSLEDVEYNMHLGRAHLYFRHVVLGKTKDEIVRTLEGTRDRLDPVPVPGRAPKIGFLFTGQGSQYPEMGKSLYEQNAVFRSHFNWCEGILKKKYGIDSLKVALWGPNSNETLSRTLYSQVGIFMVEYCLLRLWESWGIKPDLVLGHSTGEFAACVAAGIMSPEDALHLVVVRSKLIGSLPHGQMLVAMTSAEKVKEHLKKAFPANTVPLDIAAINTPDQTVVAGGPEPVQQFKTFLENNGTKSIVLHSSHAFHSRMMEPMLTEYAEALAKVKFNPPSAGCPFVSSVEGNEMEHRLDKDYWIRHTRDKVNFLGASKAAVQKSTDISMFVEIGPHPVLSAMLMNNTDDLVDDVTCLPSLRRNHDEMETMLTTLGTLYCQGVQINWGGFHQHSAANKIDIPGYSFDETQKYWLNILDEGRAPIHPLLGKPFPNASGTWIFHNTLHLNSFGFLKDHLLQKKPIFLCAGYLEMFLAAFNYVKTGRREIPTQPVGIKDFAIKVPILLDENEGTDVQVVVAHDTSGNLVGRIYTRMSQYNETFKWVENAEATSALLEVGKINWPDLKELQKSCTRNEKDDGGYERMGNRGVQLGPSLRNVKEAWEDPDGKMGCLFAYEVDDSQTEIDRFFVHPGITDPILQMQGTHYEKTTTKVKKYLSKTPIVVPTEVGTFTKWRTHIPKKGYFHVNTVNGEYIGHTYDEEGNITASITGVEFMETTVNNILALIEGQRNPFPRLAEIEWNQQLGVRAKRIGAELLEQICLQDYEQDALAHKHFNEDESFEYDVLDEYGDQCILRLVVKLGLQSYPEFTWPQICEEIGVTKVYHKYVRCILVGLEAGGWFKKDSENNFKALKPFPSEKEIQNEMDLIIEKSKSSARFKETTNHLNTLNANLKSIITGEKSAVQVFFKEDKSEPGIADFFYTESLHAEKIRGLLDVAGSIVADIGKQGNNVIRVLEVGAGVGSATRILIKKMVDAGPHLFEYTYTDLSPFFLKNGEDLLQNTGITAKYQIFNVEEDPFQQGFSPEYFDVVVASLVLHATRDLEESVMNIKKVLRPGGLLLMTELIKPHLGIDFVFGPIEGFWRFQDTHVREWNCEADPELWRQILTKQGFLDFGAYEAYNGSTALLVCRNGGKMISHSNMMESCYILLGNGECALTEGISGKLQDLGYSVISLTKESFKSENDVETKFNELFETRNIIGVLFLWGIQEKVALELAEPFLYICKFLHKQHLPQTLTLMVVTKGAVSTGPNDYISALPESSVFVGMANVLANEAQDVRCKFADYNDNMELEEAVGSILSELFIQDVNMSVAFRNTHRYVPRFKPIRVQPSALALPESARYHLILPQSNMVADLHFAACEAQPIGDNEVEIEVKAYSLNFKDLLNITKPDSVFNDETLVGMDVCGVLSAVGRRAGEKCKIGDRVFSARRSGNALPSHAVVDYTDIIPLPEPLSFPDGATLPVAASTVLQCFLRETRVTKDDVVLVHTASGGVGLVAVHLLMNHIKCEVVVTAGTERKRNYLRGLGLKHVFNSRNTRYGDDIRKSLGGRGVTVVLNTLTGQGFKEATLSLCEHGARFIEISRMNIWTKEEVEELRPDVDYRIVYILNLEPEELRSLNEQFLLLLNNWVSKKKDGLEPIPRVTFDCTEIRAALEYLEKLQHIGKVCVRMRDGKACLGGPQFPLFNKEGSYLITGGLGGIGFEIAKWMVTQGAGTIILVGRNPPSETISLAIKKMKEKTRIVVKLCDVGKYEELEPIMLSDQYPPIRGILHCAGVLDDDFYDKQTWERYEKVFQGKVKGGWNLHLLSKKLPLDLDHFVLFSSISATVGSHTQSSYVAANSYLDALGRYRVSQGLPSLTINWGLWAQVGMAANLENVVFDPFSVTKGIASLEYAMRSTKTSLCMYEGSMENMKRAFPPTRGLFADIEGEGSQVDVGIDHDKFWTEYDAAVTHEEKRNFIRGLIHTVLRNTLKLLPSDEIDDHRELQELGVDSMLLIELKNVLQAAMKKRTKITISVVKNYNTVSLLSTKLVELISGKEDVPALTREEIYSLVSKDWKLCGEAGQEIAPRSTLTDIQKVSTVLVTGATGSIGSYVVAQLAELPQIKKIVCLLRPGSMHTVADKFLDCFMKKGLYTENVKRKAKIVEGDLANQFFSLGKDDFINLTEEVEAVFHLAAKLTFTERYNDTEEMNSCRKINVEGTRVVFKFAMMNRLKHVFHASSIGIATQMDETSGTISEHWRALDEINVLPDMAYFITKFISEGHAEQLADLGVPIKVVRFTNAGPDSQTGGNIDLSHVALFRALLYMHTGSMVMGSIPFNMLPVDVAAKLSIQVFFNPNAPTGIYNVFNPSTDDEENFPQLAAEFGCTVEPVEMEEFRERINRLEDDNVFKELQNVFGGGNTYVATEKDIMQYVEGEAPFYTAWLQGNKEIYRSEKVERYAYVEGIATSFEVYKSALMAAKEEGLFEKYKIPYTK